jgi:hypothetical protein
MAPSHPIRFFTSGDDKNARMKLLGGDRVLPSRTLLSMVTFTARELAAVRAPRNYWAATRWSNHRQLGTHWLCMRPDGATMRCVYACVRAHARVLWIRAQCSFHTSLWTCRHVIDSSCYNKLTRAFWKAPHGYFQPTKIQNEYMSTPHSTCMGVKTHPM